MSELPPDSAAVLERLHRATLALVDTGEPSPTRDALQKYGAAAGVGLCTALVGVGAATGQYALVALAAGVGVLSGLLFKDRPDVNRVVGPSRPSVGMGATIGKNARLEPGANIGMGATIGAGAVVRRRAVVKMGATVQAGAVLEEGAVVSAGSDVGVKAVIGEGARIGAGASIGVGAYVPPGTRVRAGTTWNSTERPLLPAAALTPPEPDGRGQRIDAACDRLETELRQAPASAQALLGASVGTLRALRQTCHGLLRRERALRIETSPDAARELDEDTATLEQRLASATDEAIKKSLASAVAAIAEQKRQRDLMARTADRLDAELTRLLHTMDAMGAQLARIRTIGADANAEGVARDVKQLQEEIGAIADALEEIAAADRAQLDAV